MSAQRRYWSRSELALRVPRPLWWPALSITFLCLFTLFAPAGFITGMNLYLLLLAGIGWLATRQPLDATLMRAVAPFVAAIVLGLVAGIGADRYLYFKDAWYYSNPAVIIAVGFVLGRLLDDVKRGLRAFVVGGTLVALYHLIPFVLYPDLLLRQATQIRGLVGTGYYATSLVVIMLIGWWGRWRSALGLSPAFASMALLLCGMSTVLSFSRTMAMVVVLGGLAMGGFFARREWLRVGLFIAALIIGLAALQATVDTSSVQAKRSFIGKLARSAEELSVQDYSTRLDINTNWRGYETSRALDSWAQAGLAKQVFGQGFGAQVDLGLFQNLSTDVRAAVRFIPIFHNGYVYLLVKTGVVGVLLYLGALGWMYCIGRRSAGGRSDDPATLQGRALQGGVVVLAVSTWVVAGAFNKFDMFSFLMLIGFLLAARADRKPCAMKSPQRRRLLHRGCAAALAPLTAGVLAAARAGVARADDFRDAALKGFVLGGVERDIALLDAMATLGANLARVFFPLRRCRDCRQFGRADNDVQALRRLLDRAALLGMRLVVVGSFDGIEAPAFWADAELRASFVENWAWFATTFGDHPGLGGLDLMNEPNPPWPSGDIREAQALWQPLAQAAIGAVRAAGSAAPIVFEPVAGGNALGLTGMRPFADRNVVYSIHFYTPHDITHQRVSAPWQRVIPYPAEAESGLGRWDAELGAGRIDLARLERELRHVVQFQARHDVPIYVGEFSCVRWAPNGSAQRWVADCLALFTKYSWSWTYHEYRGWPGWDAEIESADPAATTRSVDAPVMQSLRRAMRSNEQRP